MEPRRYSDPKAYSTRTETLTVPRHFDQDQMNGLRAKLADLSVQAAALKEEKDEFNAEWKERNDPVKNDLKETIELVRNKYEEVEIEAHLIPNDETQMMDYVSDEGEVVYTRPMYPEERKQFHLITSADAERDAATEAA